MWRVEYLGGKQYMASQDKLPYGGVWTQQTKMSLTHFKSSTVDVVAW
jgi:hypothetical protein